jgi:hypothetical protein
MGSDDIGTIGENVVLEDPLEHSMMSTLSVMDDSTLESTMGQSAMFEGWCPYIVAFYDAFTDPAAGDLCMVLEFMNAGSLEARSARSILCGTVFSAQATPVRRALYA